MVAEDLKSKILELTKQYYEIEHNQKESSSNEIINYGGRYFDENELVNLVSASLEFWLTSGHWVRNFENKLKAFLNVKYCLAVNSGSSANLLAFMTLTSPELGERRINRGDEVITVACGFPTTVNPIIQYGAIPVFVDIDLTSYNIDVKYLELALTSKTKAVMIAHTLGNPFDLRSLKDFCQNHGLWLIEDNCDALGSTYELDNQIYYTGTIGDIGTSSFYPPHHITMGEGGAIYTNNSQLHKIAKSFRDWGRDCHCESGVDNSCGERFVKQFGELPIGYDHKYVYSHFGYNLKITEMQGSIGVAQLDKLPYIIEKRRANWNRLRQGLECLNQYFILPSATEFSNPSWFGFLITVNSDMFTRNEITKYLEDKGIQTRTLFAGNYIKHPCFESLNVDIDYRVVGELVNSDRILRDTFWVGVYQGLDDNKIDIIIDAIKDFVREFKNK